MILIPIWFKEAISKGLKVNLILNNGDIEFYIETGCKSDMVISNRYGYFIATLRSGKEYECDTYEQFKMCLKECFMGRDFCHQYVTNILGEL